MFQDGHYMSRPLEASTIMALKLRPGFSVTVPGVRIIDVSKPEWLEYIQKTNFDNYQKGPVVRSLMGDLFGKGILVSDGALWKRSRMVISRAFHPSTFKTIIEPGVDQSLHGLFKVLKGASDESRDLDFCNLFSRYILDTFVKMTMKRSCGTIHDYAYALIDERLSKISSDDDFTNCETFQEDFLGIMMAVHRKQESQLNREELRDAALSFLLAGRLHPAVPKNLKFAKADDIIPGGPTIEAGDCVTWCDWQMARDPEVWGADCGQFQPNRWIDEAEKIKNFGNYKFHSFNGGLRHCVGMNLAIFINIKTIVEILQNFDLEFSEGWLKNVPKSGELDGIKTDYPTPQYQASLSLPMKNPMMISVKPRLTQDSGL
uniref:Putative cytochrome P450 n=1 Tax=Puccinia horiana TaxID=331382 RepID=W8FTD7_9BASI|nr:putative cytochrome P450 [Puccinia horiana]